MKFVIHHHTGNPREEAHYDVMIESYEALLTWRISESAMKKLLEGKEVSASRIADHRKAYLTYEGPISCDRGVVKIMDCGTYTPQGCDNNVTRYTLAGNVFHGMLITKKAHGHNYSFRYIPSVEEKMH